MPAGLGPMLDGMPALVFDFNLRKLATSKLRGMVNQSGHWHPAGPVGIRQVPKPEIVADDWLIVKTALCGICGSDMKEVTLHGAIDNPLQAFLSFPQIMGHEPVGSVEEVGPAIKTLKPGDRVAVSPWFGCGPRGIDPPCPRCVVGDFTHCMNFQSGRLPPGMHLGVTKGFGGFAPFFAAHESQCFAIPDEVSFDDAVLADPFSVAFHSCLLLDPDPASTVLVYGAGIIGLLTIACLKRLFGVRRVLAVGRHRVQADWAMRLGAERVFQFGGEKLIEEVAAATDAELFRPDRGPRWAMAGVDAVIDTIGSGNSFEAGMRFLATRGKLVFTGVDTPKRFENTPHYFKELEVIGSNAYAVERFEGKRSHAFEFFLEFLVEKRIDLSGMVTHKFRI